MFFTYKLLYSSTLMLGMMIAISSSSWLMSWMGLEINMLSFLVLMKNSSNKLTSEAMIKYFITQSLASTIFLFSIIMFTNTKIFNEQLSMIHSIILNMALFLKMGAAPLHFWFPEVMSGSPWMICLTLSTLQKVAPILLLTNCKLSNNLMIIIIMMSSFISSIQNINQVCMRKIMAYSSINHTSWMIAAMMISVSSWMIYFFTYSMILINIIMVLSFYKIFFMNQLSKIMLSNKSMKMLFMLNFMSLGGLPPFLGFMPKWIIINHLTINKFYFLTFFMILFSLIALFVYIRIMMSSLTLNTSESLNSKSPMIMNWSIYMNLLLSSSLISCLLISSLY
uniref:NADH-ubiquinone oxidoreductase chain 2 n=1 Tax=Xyloterini sp. TaxID=2995406 RepID=A0A9E8K0T2_9CUCU|nr:NADH dehydrogenase subunit 2 [Xyloterini sp.]